MPKQPHKFILLLPPPCDGLKNAARTLTRTLFHSSSPVNGLRTSPRGQSCHHGPTLHSLRLCLMRYITFHRLFNKYYELWSNYFLIFFLSFLLTPAGCVNPGGVVVTRQSFSLLPIIYLYPTLAIMDGPFMDYFPLSKAFEGKTSDHFLVINS